MECQVNEWMIQRMNGMLLFFSRVFLFLGSSSPPLLPFLIRWWFSDITERWEKRGIEKNIQNYYHLPPELMMMIAIIISPVSLDSGVMLCFPDLVLRMNFSLRVLLWCPSSSLSWVKERTKTDTVSLLQSWNKEQQQFIRDRKSKFCSFLPSLERIPEDKGGKQPLSREKAKVHLVSCVLFIHLFPG